MSNLTFIELPSPKNLDIISVLKFLPTQNHLLATSWDNTVLLYDCSNPEEPDILTKFQTECPIISVAHGISNVTYVGSLDGSVRELDYENLMLSKENFTKSLTKTLISDNSTSIGINNLCIIPDEKNLIISSSFGGEMNLIDTRQRKSIFARKLSSKIFQMDASKNHLAVSLKSNQIEIYDIRNLNKPFEIREIGLKYQIKDLKTFPNGEGFALSTIDGRVSLEYFDPSPEVQLSKRFTFKCHRSHDKLSQLDFVYPVNSIAFNSQYNTLFTAGSDGFLCLWDCEKKKRMRLYSKFAYSKGTPESIVKIDLNYDNRLIAAATSDDSFKNFSALKTEKQPLKYPSKIYIRQLGERECMPKN